MTRHTMTAILGITSVILCGAVHAQSTPSTSSPSSVPSATTSPARSSDSASQPAGEQKDSSRGAKEQQSQKQKCPKNGDNSNVNCKERGKAPK